jgi:hypothetical protein
MRWRSRNFLRNNKTLFADENQDAGGQREDVKQKNSWPEIQTEPKQAIDDQVNRQQNHADVFCDFHGGHLTTEDAGAHRVIPLVLAL